jgi:hypothetical protein
MDDARRDRLRTLAESSQTPVFNPYASGMWVIRGEDYLHKITKKKWTWKKPIVKNGNQMVYRWVGRKPKNGVVPPTFRIGFEYDKGADMFNVEALYFDAQANKVASKQMKHVPLENLFEPEVLFGWVKSKWDPKTKTLRV